MPEPQYATCSHVMASGLRCGSPALKGQDLCYHHTTLRQLLPRRFGTSEEFRNLHDHGVRLFPMPPLEDATAIQIAVMQVIHSVLEGALHFRAAQMVMGGLRIAQRNLAAMKLERSTTAEFAVQAGRSAATDAAATGVFASPNTKSDRWPHRERTQSPPEYVGSLGEREPILTPMPGDDKPAPVEWEIILENRRARAAAKQREREEIARREHEAEAQARATHSAPGDDLPVQPARETAEPPQHDTVAGTQGAAMEDPPRKAAGSVPGPAAVDEEAKSPAG